MMNVSKTKGKLLLWQIISALALCPLFHAAAWHDVVAAQQLKRGASFQQPQNREASVHYASGNSALRIPFEIYANVIFLQVHVNNSPPLWFILDTGAGASVISASRAKNLGLSGKVEVNGRGMGGSVKGTLINGATISVSGVEVFNQRIAALPIDPLTPRLGRTVDGFIGYDFIKQFVFEINYVAKIINLYDPQSYKYSGSGEIIPFTIRGGTPFTRLKINASGREAIEGVFEVDTGSDGALSINAPFAKAHRLLESLPKTSETQKGAGAGGETDSVASRVNSLQLGRFTFENPIIAISQDMKGEGASSKSDGQIGTELFRRFKVILDYSRGRLILEPNKDFSEPYEDDMSGIDLIAEGADLKTFTINSIKANSPAAEAGLREEDVIVAINGHPAAEFQLDPLTRMFMKDGQEYVLSIKRGQEIITAKIKLRRLI